jgi:hypothetical protein
MARRVVCRVVYLIICDIARYSYIQNITNQLSVMRSLVQAITVRTISSHSHPVIALMSWCIGVISLVSTWVMYPLLHTSMLVQITLVFCWRQLGRTVPPCRNHSMTSQKSQGDIIKKG